MEQFTAQDWVIILGALGILINNTISNWKMNGKVNAINATAEVIKGHVNSATTKAEERAVAAADREKALQETIVRLRTSADLLAQAAAIKDASRRNSDAGSAPAPIIVPVQTLPVEHSAEVIETVDTPKATKSEIKKIADNLEIKPKGKS